MVTVPTSVGIQNSAYRIPTPPLKFLPMGINSPLLGYNALITGSSRGIGKATALELAKLGANVVVHYNTHREGAVDVAKTIQQKFKRQAHTVQADLSTYKGSYALAHEALKAFGKIDIFVANAGFSTHFGLEDIKPEEWNKSLAVNLSHAFFVTQKLAPVMKTNRFGRIILVSSLRARSGSAKGPHYASAKAGLHGLAKSLALELGPHGITVNVVVPGYTLTDMTRKRIEKDYDKIISRIPSRKVASPQEVARLIAFLALPESDYINGAVVDINGGIYFPP